MRLTQNIVVALAALSSICFVDVGCLLAAEGGGDPNPLGFDPDLAICTAVVFGLLLFLQCQRRCAKITKIPTWFISSLPTRQKPELSVVKFAESSPKVVIVFSSSSYERKTQKDYLKGRRIMSILSKIGKTKNESPIKNKTHGDR